MDFARIFLPSLMAAECDSAVDPRMYLGMGRMSAYKAICRPNVPVCGAVLKEVGRPSVGSVKDVFHVAIPAHHAPRSHAGYHAEFFLPPGSPSSSSSGMDGLRWRYDWIQADGFLNPSYRDKMTYYYSNLPDATIFAPIENGMSIEDIKVPKQRAYTDRKPVIRSSLADIPSANLGVDGLMKMLNSKLGTEHDLTPSLSSLLEVYISKEYDFGTIYGYLRPVWFGCDLNVIEATMRVFEETDRKLRRAVLADDKITFEGQRMSPRRVWDLFSNRVVPWWAAFRTPWGISHAWMDKSRRKNALTPINGHQWPVPIPDDANLDLVRIEMLNLGAEYAWLDVLCLRQEGGQHEDLRAEEWMLDVPNIGNAYILEKVVCYFNGLGRPLERGFDSDSDRSGNTGDERLNEEVRERFQSQLSSVQRVSVDIVRLLSLLQDRTSEKDVDKVAALAFFLASLSTPAHNETRPATSTTHEYTKIDPTSNDNSIGTGGRTSTIAPAYSELESAENAWTALVKAVGWYCCSSMLLLYHEPGPEKNTWRPSWQQAMNWDTRSITKYSYIFPTGPVSHNLRTDTYSYDGWYIKSVQVQGLATPVAAPREGHLTIETRSWYKWKRRYRYKLSTRHQYPIPDGEYSLLLCHNEFRLTNRETVCVVGEMLPDQTFIKTSVVEIIDWPEDEKKWERKALSRGAIKSSIVLG
ncbi:hypothetical protein F5146DRAFT_1130945 [Armillaria mellea]|nr:hypothetical protein F5146DRAFT_1130945 [Armillaria mellea]